jgi:hypothetical protein
MELFIYAFEIFTVLSAIVSSIYFYKYKKTYLSIICPFLWYTALNEIVVGRVLNHLKHISVFYNIHQIILFSVIFWIIYKNLKDSKCLQILKILFGSYAIIQIIDLFTKNIITDYLTLSYFTGGIISIIGIMLFAIELLRSKNIKPIRKDLVVWFLIANLIFWIGYLPIYIIFDNYYETIGSELYNSLKKIQFSFIILLNLIYILGFIYTEKRSPNS